MTYKFINKEKDCTVEITFKARGVKEADKKLKSMLENHWDQFKLKNSKP